MTKIPEIKLMIQIPEGVQVEVKENNHLICTGSKGTLEKRLEHPEINIQKDGNKVEVRCELPNRKEKALAGTFASLIRNMIAGVTRGYEYKMKTVYSHFPIKTSVNEKQVIIENFLGEKYPRKAKIIGDTTVNIKGEEFTLTGINLDDVSQTAANIEHATRVRKRDIRVFQDGIYITQKGD